MPGARGDILDGVLGAIGRKVGNVGRVTGRAVGRGVTAPVRWSGWRRPGGRFGLHGLAVAVVLGAAVVAGVYVVPAVTRTNPTAQQHPRPGAPTTAPPQDGQAGLSGTTGPEPSTSASPAPTGSASTNGPTALAGWANSLARLGIPTTALEAYGYAELVTTRTDATCHLTWTTLAGIGKIESDHGQEGGATLLANGTSSPPIFGPPLDGTNGNKRILNTGSNPWDPASTYVRAIGPMQFLPDTWKTWGTDGDGDGKADPFDVYDAAVSAARYLCANNHDLSTGSGWWTAIHSYNDLDRYASNVYAAANDYGLRSHA